jgi:hypothetical protein
MKSYIEDFMALAGGSDIALCCDLRAQAPFAVRWLVSCLVGVDEVTTANTSRSLASVGRRTRVTPSRYRSRLGTPAFENNRGPSNRQLCVASRHRPSMPSIADQ